MIRENVLNILKKNIAKISRFGITKIAVIGSVARDEANSESDLDLLVDFEGPLTFDRYMDVKIFLEDLLDCKIDLVIADGLHPSIKAEINQDAVYVA